MWLLPFWRCAGNLLLPLVTGSARNTNSNNTQQAASSNNRSNEREKSSERDGAQMKEGSQAQDRAESDEKTVKQRKKNHNKKRNQTKKKHRLPNVTNKERANCTYCFRKVLADSDRSSGFHNSLWKVPKTVTCSHSCEVNMMFCCIDHEESVKIQYFSYQTKGRSATQGHSRPLKL